MKLQNYSAIQEVKVGLPVLIRCGEIPNSPGDIVGSAG